MGRLTCMRVAKADEKVQETGENKCRLRAEQQKALQQYISSREG